ncbi:MULTISPECIES: NAD(P)-dependent alcohol dehydrogenase [Microbacterium]|uniref:NAD(P)-dependent alcohol dehydrogenase n=1 Tax=Microbacterium wangchenii TaxID=2541726 RepID=A0ABX5SZF0_9MICO|nr:MULTISPECIES: NAD(P)-dependent alcohol dehydrogenase [Microbacterium]MCK6066206.1 NAD(P)-dependent alcohol dehydrogenase [Microbacterium sp. EYE_512]QBR90478.1 NAD(P)-dependent alcohol dehydrogenase [Microbacterium wangchenii]TXK14504.1 NAD(P)-dependent alcohol dehydrogenase [Microbacterium wangchenii]
MSLPATMQASVLLTPGTIELQEVPVPAAGPGEVLVRVTAVGSCGSDTHFYETGAIGDLIVRGPVVLGHETAGEIVAVGDGVDHTRVGTRVAVEPQTPCRRCEFCKTGRYHLCRDIRFYGAWPIDGSFAEYVIVDDDFAHAIPDSMTDEEAALVEPVSVAVHAARRGGVTRGSKVLVTGAGPIGVIVAQVVKSFGAAEVVISDPIPHRRDFALSHGADVVLDPAEADLDQYSEYFDVYIDASGNARAVQSAFPTIVRGGTAVLVGMGGNTLEVPIAMIQHREITLTGTFRYVNTWPTAIQLVASGTIEVASLVTGRFGLEDVEKALMQSKTDPVAIKTMVIPGHRATAPATAGE